MTSTVDPEEIARFSALSAEWWNPRGPLAPLHAMNPARIGWIMEQVASCKLQLKGLSLLDIGCGGGLIAEPMARLGAHVTAIDASETNIAVARTHAAQSGLQIDYRHCAAESLLNEARGTRHEVRFDLILALEIIEHVEGPAAFVDCCLKLVKPGGLIIFSTLNRTAKAYAMAILGAEYLLRLLPKGTHDWKKFLKPSELAAHARGGGGELSAMTGLIMHPLTGEWRTDPRNVSVNYMMAVRPKSA